MLRMFVALIWAMITAVFLFVLSLPVSVEAQLALGITALLVMVAIHALRLKGVWRMVYLALSIALIARYMTWRVTSTLPAPDDLINFLPAIILLGAEIYAVLMLAMSYFVIVDPLERASPPVVDETNAPTVDVFIPSYNEGIDLLGVTLAAARAMDYPPGKMTVFLLDDGGTDEKCESTDARVAASARQRRQDLQALCKTLDVTYVTRPRNEHAKAGNLNNGLAYAHGELVVVFDADHAPAKEFLRETVGHFLSDPRLFLVQTPHLFLNPDPLERSLGTFGIMPSENEMFYGTLQRGLDRWNAAFFCGSAAVLRRTALDEAGGFSGVTITEDAETALELHSRGWHSVYVDRPMIAGLQPETFETFVGQRSRWCRGMVQLFLLKNPLGRPGLNMAQRVSYLANMMFWFFPFSRLIFMLAPLFFVFFDLQIFVGTKQEFIAYTTCYLAGAVLAQNYLFGRLRWSWVSEIYEYVQAVYLSGAILSVLRNARAPKFNVTQKGLTLNEDRLSHLALPYFVIFGLLVVGLAMLGWRYLHEPLLRDLLTVLGLWTAFNLAIAGASLSVVCERRERRRHSRIPSGRTATLILPDLSVTGTIDEVSFGGVRFRPLSGSVPFAPGKRDGRLSVAVGTRSLEVPVTLVQTASDAEGRTFGVRFEGLSADQFRAVADLIYGDMGTIRRGREARRGGQGILRQSLRLVTWSLRFSLRAAYFAIFRRASPGRTAGT